MFGFGFNTNPTCDNCGHKLQKPDEECFKCGYKKPITKTLDPISLVYCEGCGCTYSQAIDCASVCNIHPKEAQKKIL
jgi:hypothetical protein